MQKALTVGDQSTTIYFPDANAAGRPPVLVLHPWWGLNDDVKALADRVAEAGFTVGAPDLFRGQTAATIEEAEKLSSSAEESTAFLEGASTAAADAVLAEGGSNGPLGVVGMSFGGAWAIWLSAHRSDVGALVLYYGTWVDDILTRSMAPILGHFAETDQYEDADTITELEKICRAAGRPIEVHTYPGTGHWFAEPSQQAYVADAAEKAFNRTVAFLHRQLG